PEFNLTIVEVPEGANAGLAAAAAAPTSAAAVRAYVDAQPDLSLGPTVYQAADSPMQEGLIVTEEILVKFKPGTDAAAQRRLLERNHLEVRRTDYPEPGAMLVAATDDQDPLRAANTLHESELVDSAEPNFVRLAPRPVGPMPALAPDQVSPQPPTREPEMGIIAADQVGQVLEAMPAPAVPAAPAATPTDPGFASQWGLKKIKAPEAFDITMGSAAISVAVIDEGCNLAHEDLTFKLPGYDAVTGTDNQEPKPADGHGTSCAGIVAAKANNGRGGVGVAPNCRVLPVRIAYGAGGGWVTTDAKIADGVRKAVDRGADVLSNSWGGGAPSTFITNAFKYAQSNGRGGKGCPIAIATGNADVRGVGYPANLSPSVPGLLAVGASNEWDQRKSKTSLDGETWWGSNYGPEVDVVAPGVHIYTTDITGAAGYGGGNYVPNFNGTSSATPHVAGLMALILSVDPDLRSWEVEDLIKLTVDDLGAPGRDEQFGFGRINCRRALEAAARIWYEVSAVPEFIGAGKECFMRLNVRVYNPGINSVRLDALTVTSHTADWATEIDRFEYRPTPGGAMAPRSGNDVRLNRLLLKANGNRSSYACRWALNWSYTFWRPGAPGAPMAAGDQLTEAAGRRVIANPIRGSVDAPQRPGVPTDGAAGTGDQAAMLLTQPGAGTTGDSITIDRQTKTITIVIR
ncbi:MAG: S8 family serine peptidase, partial [Chloroflexota bacterium]